MSDAIPPLLAERLAELDRIIFAQEEEITHCEAQIKGAWLSLEKYRLAKAEVENAIALCRGAWCQIPAADMARMREAAAAADLQYAREAVAAAHPASLPPRQRRDMREVVRQILRGWPDGAGVLAIAEKASADGRKVRVSEITNALARMDGEVEIGTVNGVACWRLAVGPAGAVDSQALLEKHLVRDPTLAEAGESEPHSPADSAGDTEEGDGSSPPPTDDEILDHIAQAGERGLDRDEAHAFAARNRAGLRYLLMTNRLELTERGYRVIDAAQVRAGVQAL